MARVLIIEDDPDLRAFLTEALIAAGYEAVAAADGAAGLRHLQNQPTDLVITDILMPEKDGLEVLWELHSTLCGPKIIAMSGAPSQWKVLDTAEKLGASRTLRKPFTKQEVLGAVAQVLADNT